MRYRIEKLIPGNIRVRGHTLKNSMLNNMRYNAFPNPYKPIWIDAKDIDFLISNSTISPIKRVGHGGLGQVKGGDWPQDENLELFDEHYIKTSVFERFLLDKKWENTKYYDHLINKYEKKFSDGLAKEKVDERLSMVDNLYRSISENGYEANYVGKNHKKKIGYRELFEPFVIIGSDGDLYLWDGRHRFAIAQILDLNIPVHVVCRHKQWQELRDDIHNNDLSIYKNTNLEDHPDLKDILYNS